MATRWGDVRRGAALLDEGRCHASYSYDEKHVAQAPRQHSGACSTSILYQGERTRLRK